jgi:hypothetical protein
MVTVLTERLEQELEGLALVPLDGRADLQDLQPSRACIRPSAPVRMHTYVVRGVEFSENRTSKITDQLASSSRPAQL